MDEIKKILLTQLQLCQKRSEKCYDSDLAALTSAMVATATVYASLCEEE